MAEKLVLYYKYIGEQKGIEGRMLLASETKIPSILAPTTQETPEIIERFKKAIEKITGKPAPTL